jgi:hypothetical protein
MGNLVTGHANKIIVGPARILIAVLGTTEPPTNVDPVVWDAAWKEVGYTDDGLQFVYNPTFKDTTVDEEMAPIDSFLNGETARSPARSRSRHSTTWPMQSLHARRPQS